MAGQLFTLNVSKKTAVSLHNSVFSLLQVEPVQWLIALLNMQLNQQVLSTLTQREIKGLPSRVVYH